MVEVIVKCEVWSLLFQISFECVSMSESGLRLLEWLQQQQQQQQCSLVEDVEKDSIPSLSVDRLLVDMSDVIANSCLASSSSPSWHSGLLSHADVIDYSLHYLETIFCLIRSAPVTCDVTRHFTPMKNYANRSNFVMEKYFISI